MAAYPAANDYGASVSASSDEDDADLLGFAKKCYRKHRAKHAKWREKAREDYGFVSGGEQWTDTEKQMLQDQLRVPVTFNRVGTIIDSVAGYEVNNRQETRFIPRKLGDSPVNELLTGAAKWIRDECDAEDEESDAFLDLIVCGMGWTETCLDYAENDKGDVKINRMDPLEAVWDPAATKRNLGDATFVGRIRKLPRHECEALVDKTGSMPLGDMAPWTEISEEGDEPHDQTQAKFYTNDQGGNIGDDQGDWTVFQLQWNEMGEVYKVFDPNGQNMVEMAPERYRALSGQARKLGIPIRAEKIRRRLFKQAFFCGETVLSQGPCPDPKRFTLRCMTGKRDRNHGTWYGLVRAMKDPQKWANKFLSQIMHIVNSNAKGGIIAEAGAFEDQRQAEDTWADPTGITWAANGAIRDGRIKDKPQAQYPSGVDRLMEFAVTSIRDVTGVNVETLGLADRDQPGILEAHRKAAAMVILAPLFDSLRRYRKEQGRVLLCFITHYLSDGRLVRIEGPEMAQYVPLIHDDATIEYDVIVDDAPTSPNQKEQVFAILAQMMPMLLKANVPMPPDLLDYTPLPTSLVAKWKQTMAQHQQQGPPPDPKMITAQAQVALGQQKAQMDAQHTAMAAQADAADDQRRAQLEMQKAQMQMQIDREKAQNEIAIQQQKSAAEIEQSRQRAAVDIEIARQKAMAQMAGSAAGGL